MSCRTCAEPVPLSGIVVGEVGALLTSIRLLAELVPDVGVKLTVKAVDFPGANVSGIARPVRPKPVPGPPTCVMLRLAPPALVRVTVCEVVWPTVTVPKFTLPGATEICGWTPIPLSATVETELAALLTTEMLPLALPAPAGAKLTVKAVDWPGPSVIGTARPVMPKPFPAIVA